MPFIIVFTLRDAANNDATTEVKIPDSFTLSDYTEFGAGMATAINDFVRGRIMKAELCLPIDVSGFTGNTISILSDVEEIGAFEFVTAQGNRVKLNIPGCPDGVTLPNSNTLDEADAQVATIITAMEDGLAVTGGTASPCDIGGDDIVDTLFARENFRSSGTRKK